jgi:hypothetical protein
MSVYRIISLLANLSGCRHDQTDMRPTEPDPNDFTAPIPKAPHSTPSTNEPNKRPKSSVAEFLGVGLATLVGLLLVGVGCLQYRILSKQAVISKQYNHFTALSQRPFVSIAPGNSYVSGRSGNYMINYLIDFTNNGNTAATHAFKRSRCDKSKSDLAEPWSFMQSAKPPITQVFIGPHSSSQGGCSFAMDDMQQMEAGELFGYILADVAYTDPLSPKTPKRTQFEVRLEQVSIGKTNGGVVVVNALMRSVGEHNCADDDCPN